MNGYAVRALGAPYFSMVVDHLEFMDAPNLYVSGPYQFEVDVALLAMPVRNADDDEIHALMSFREFPIGDELFSLGITPSGRVVGTCFSTVSGTKADVVIWSQPGTIQADRQFHKIVWNYDPGILHGYVTLDGVTVAEGDPARDSGVFAVPYAGRVAQLVLFNGANGLTRIPCEVRFAALEMTDGAPRRVEYRFTEGSGGRLTAKSAAGALVDGQNWDVTANWMQLIVTPPWGPVPTNKNIASTFSWQLRTDFRVRELPATEYRPRSA